jgi:hypothetical protein
MRTSIMVNKKLARRVRRKTGSSMVGRTQAKIRKTADRLLGVGRATLFNLRAGAIAWIASKKPQRLTVRSVPKIARKTRTPRMPPKAKRTRRVALKH